jgi:hypothetical protein
VEIRYPFFVVPRCTLQPEQAATCLRSTSNRVPGITTLIQAAMMTVLAIAASATASATASRPLSGPSPPWRILPLGDSITLGCGYEAGPLNDWAAVCSHGSGSYRAGLWAALNASGARTRFVGTSPEGGGPSWMPEDQRSHEGHGGWTVPMLRTIINSTLVKTKPDAILLLAGTNDVGQNHSLARITADMAGLLGDIKAGAPRVSDTHVCVCVCFSLPRPLSLSVL